MCVHIVTPLTFRAIVWASVFVRLHWGTDVLEVFSPLSVTLTFQTACPQHQKALEQTLHQVHTQVLWTGERKRGVQIQHSNRQNLMAKARVQKKCDRQDTVDEVDFQRHVLGYDLTFSLLLRFLSYFLPRVFPVFPTILLRLATLRLLLVRFGCLCLSSCVAANPSHAHELREYTGLLP